jgi:small subunit ribosomal protein S36
VPRAVWALTLLHGLLLVHWSMLVPVYHAPDEPAHVDQVFVVRTGSGWPEPDSRFLSGQIVESFQRSFFDPHGEPRDARSAEPRGRRPTFRELGRDGQTQSPNQQWQHPPLYYVWVATTVSATAALVPLPGGWAYDQMIWLMRFAGGILLLLPLPALGWLAARRLGAPPPAAAMAAVLPLAVPQLTHIGSTVNNDNLLTLATGLLTVLVAAVLAGDVTTRTAVKTGLVTVGALLTKGFALVLPMVVGVAYGLVWLRARSAAVVRSLVTALAVAALGGGWWWLRNLVAYGTLQPQDSRFARPAAESAPLFGDWLWWLGVLMVRRFWGWFGWYEAAMPAWVAWTATGVVLLGVVLAFALRGDDRPTRPALLVLLLPFLLILGVVLGGGWAMFSHSGVPDGLQGRYLFPGLVGLGVVTGIGAARALGRHARWGVVTLLVLAGAMQVAGSHAALMEFWGVGHGELTSIRALLAWSPWPPAVLWASWVGAGLAGVWALVELSRRPA